MQVFPSPKMWLWSYPYIHYTRVENQHGFFASSVKVQYGEGVVQEIYEIIRHKMTMAMWMQFHVYMIFI